MPIPEFWLVDTILAVLFAVTLWVCLDSTYWGDYPLGDDGLTENERADAAHRYHTGIGRKYLTDGEREVIKAWRER